jgi:hypothetical protein
MKKALACTMFLGVVFSQPAADAKGPEPVNDDRLANGGDLDKVYFSAGLNHETHGLFGSLCSVLSPTCP